MKFNLSITNKYKYSAEQLKEFGFSFDDDNELLYEFEEYFRHPAIEFNTLEEITKFVSLHGNVIIKESDFDGDQDYTLEIYNDYRE